MQAYSSYFDELRIGKRYKISKLLGRKKVEVLLASLLGQSRLNLHRISGNLKKGNLNLQKLLTDRVREILLYNQGMSFLV